MPEIEKKSLSIPISRFDPVNLFRPLKLFGRDFKVHISTSLTFSPDTVLRASVGLSGMQILRGYQDTEGTRSIGNPAKSLKDLLRAATGTNKISTTTIFGVKKTFGHLFDEQILDALLQGSEPSEPVPWRSDWEYFLQGLGDKQDDNLHDVVRRLCLLDRTAWSVRQLPVDEAVALLRAHIEIPHERWRVLNPKLNLRVAYLVDCSLQTLAWMECSFNKKCNGDSLIESESLFLPLLKPEKKPLGHWILKLQTLSNSTSLAEFSSVLLKKGARRHSFSISHDLLKKWSSGQQLMPGKAAESVLIAMGERVDIDKEKELFAAARFLSFLCDLIVAGTSDEEPTWKSAQEQIFKRYRELLANSRPALDSENS